MKSLFVHSHTHAIIVHKTMLYGLYVEVLLMVANRHFFTYTDLSILQSKFGDQICTDFISDHLFFFAKFHSISEFFFVICLKSLSFFYPLKLKKKKHLKISFLYKPKSICILSEAKLAISSLIKFLKSMGTCPLENGMCN